MSTRQKSRKRQATFDLRDYERTRRYWKPNWERLESELQQSNEYPRRKHGKPPLNP
ncbi:MAG: hypothetical protein IPP14_00235 [Planctomycetes bacterium]|nr:hypothetical protein [Planctomycetota bacterium]